MKSYTEKSPSGAGEHIICKVDKSKIPNVDGEYDAYDSFKFAQDESRSISENCTWGIRRRFEQGKHKMSTKRFLGYDYDEDGNLVINRQQAKVVVRLYEEFLSGKTVDYIARIFTAEKIKSWDGKCNWVPSTLDSMLRNEKYMGDTILQKSYTVEFLSKKRVMNDGTIQKFHIEEDHEAIIPPDMWQAVQMEIERRDAYVKAHKTTLMVKGQK